MARDAVSHAVMNHLRRIVHALRSSHRAAGTLKLTGAQLFVLNVLGASPQPLSVSELAQRTETDQSTVSVVVGRLVRRGLVRRERAADDNRRAELSLTARGRAIHKRAPATVPQQKLAAALEALPDRRARELLRTLDLIVAEMGIASASPPMLFDEPAPERKKRSRK